MARTLQELLLVCCVLIANSSRLQRREIKHANGALNGVGAPAMWDMAWSKEIVHLHGKAARELQTSVDSSVQNWKSDNWNPVFETRDDVPSEQTTMLQTLGTRHAEDWTGLVLHGKSFWKTDSETAHLLTQWKDEYAAHTCGKVFAGHTQDDAHQEIFMDHCHAITGHTSNHGIGGVLKEIIELGHVHMSLRADAHNKPGHVAENHWFGVLAYNDHEREAWLKKHEEELCQISGENVLILPLESSELSAYKAATPKQAFPEDTDHVTEDGRVHDNLDELPTHNMIGRLVFRYECHGSDGWRPKVKEISLLIQD